MNLRKKSGIAFLLVVFSLAASSATAAEGGGNFSSLAKVAAIVVNLQGAPRQYIQVEMTLKFSRPELVERVKTYMPAIRHRMILLLSGKDANQLNPIEGKQKLLQESKAAVNQALELTDKDGISDVLFTSFIIQ